VSVACERCDDLFLEADPRLAGDGDDHSVDRAADERPERVAG
jgi:hypothetical protein